MVHWICYKVSIPYIIKYCLATLMGFVSRGSEWISIELYMTISHVKNLHLCTADWGTMGKFLMKSNCQYINSYNLLNIPYMKQWIHFTRLIIQGKNTPDIVYCLPRLQSMHYDMILYVVYFIIDFLELSTTSFKKIWPLWVWEG